MRTSPAEKDNKILQVIFFLCDKVITCRDTQHLLYEATDLAFFFTYKRQITGDDYTFGNKAHNSCHAYFDNFVKNTVQINRLLLFTSVPFQSMLARRVDLLYVGS